MTEKKTAEAEKYLSDNGYGKGTNFTISTVAYLMEAYAAQQSNSPVRCPVCGGNGMVPNGFYNTVTGVGSTTSINPETCLTCNGSGVYTQQSKMPTAPLK